MTVTQKKYATSRISMLDVSHRPLYRSLYLHFPFCEVKCHYCDFYSLGQERTRPGDANAFEGALRLEIQKKLPEIAPQLDTIFLGGGTPSMTAYDSMARALEPLWSVTSLGPHTEWTMEANPSSISLETFQAFRSLGINRISMGVQALKPELLQLLGRVHSGQMALDSLRALFDAGFTNVSVDLLCGVPGQTLTDLENALTALNAFPLTHFSCYLLTLPPHHRLYEQLPHEDTQLEHLLFVHQWLTQNAFEHYEISNFAKATYQAQHNLHYWKGSPYLGFGPSAHSFDAHQGRRWKNVSSLHRYVRLIEEGNGPEETAEILTPEQRELEKWLLSLRLHEGVPDTWLQTPGQQAKAQTFKEMGLMESGEINPLSQVRSIRLTPRGFAVADQIIRALV